MDVEELIERLERLVAEARPVPLSSSIMLNRQEIEDLIQELRTSLPEEMRQARWIIKERDEILAQAARESEQLLADTRAERERLLSEQEVVKAAEREGERIVTDAREQARVLRLEAEDYVDGKLANFELVLQKTLKAVERGRERLHGRLASDELADTGEQEPVAADEGTGATQAPGEGPGEEPAAGPTSEAGPEPADPERPRLYDHERLDGER